ncbi:MAG: sulfotransferase family 2 domain-containing protein [Pseudopelagicola sp.]|nr:sulfotransferase family 2 domain-containing protein [Pseudopelagicola sp.]
MPKPFDYFVVFAEMRTGSNFLETNLNAFEGIACYGEAFNPHFVGYPNKKGILGVDLEARTKDPFALIQAIRRQDGGIGGFRYFHDHDPRILDTCLTDPRCAKIVLTRNPIDSYVSLKIARATGQWKLTDVRRRKEAGKIHFDKDEFRTHVENLQAFQLLLMNRLQTTGQTAFYVAYEDLQDVDVMNGLARFLGVDETLEALDTSLKRQNPSPISEKVANFADVSAALSELDRFNITRTPNFEPRRSPAVPTYVMGAEAPLLFMPMRSGPEDEVRAWMAALDGVSIDDLPTKANQKDLRIWRRTHKGHRSFTVLRHPVARAHAAFCRKVLSVEEGSFAAIRKTLRKLYKVPLPDGPTGAGYDLEAHRAAFLAFLAFVKANLAGQTSIRIDGHWATQSATLKGFGELCFPDIVVREEDMESYLPALAMQVGYRDAPEPNQVMTDAPFALEDVYTDKIEDLVSDIYQRDYLNFGFDRWR